MPRSEVLKEQEPQQEDRSEPERFVDSVVAANFLSIERQMLMRLARQGKIPAYPLGDGQRRIWRFRLSELAKAMEQRKLSEKRGASAGGAKFASPPKHSYPQSYPQR